MNDLQRTIFGQSEVVGNKHQRLADDYYPTPEGITRSLLNRIPITGTVFEGCAGHGAISDVLQSRHRTEIAVFQSDLGWPSPNGEVRDATERTQLSSLPQADLQIKVVGSGDRLEDLRDNQLSLVSLVFRHPDLGLLKALSYRSNLASF